MKSQALEFICPNCHTSDDRPVVEVELDDGTKLPVHKDCQQEVEELKQKSNNRRTA